MDDHVPEAWRELLSSVSAIETAAALAGITTTPAPGEVFEAFRYMPPSGVKVVILGQEPQGCGFSWATPEGHPPTPALKNIFACIGDAPTGDLRPWAAQGVLLLNTSLTAVVGKKNEHSAVWEPITGALLRALCDMNPKLVVLAWGTRVRAWVAKVACGATVLEWTHPSPVIDAKLEPRSQFRNCPHFTKVTSIFGIDWRVRSPITICTDGSCVDNGAPTAVASFAAACYGGPLSGVLLADSISPTEYAFIDPANPAMGIKTVPEKKILPSCNRAELLAIIYALLGVLVTGSVGPVEIVTDSKICLGTLTQWLPNRLAKGTERELKNYDLVEIAWRLVCEVRKITTLEFTLIKAHQPPPPRAAGERARMLNAGNAAADKSAREVSAGKAPVRKNIPHYLADGVWRPL